MGDDPAGFLYPFLDAREEDLATVLRDVARSTVQKGEDSIALRRTIDLAAVAACGGAIGERLRRGGRLISFGNGGSATDAQDVAADCLARGWPAVALVNDVSTVTAVANDVGVENVFARQLIALGGPADVALGISTSGASANVLTALEQARRRGMLTIALTGYGGGAAAGLAAVEHLLTVSGDYVPRIQEAHATVLHLLLEVVGSPA